MEKGACISGAASGSCLRYSVTRISVERVRGSPKPGCEVWPGVWDLGGVGSRSHVLTVTCQSFLLGGPCTRWVRAPAQIPLAQPCSVPALALFALRFKLDHVVPSGL